MDDYKTLKNKIKILSKDTNKNYNELFKIYEELLHKYYQMKNNYIKK
jgi:hypothetical protein